LADKIESLEERFINQELTKELYDKYRLKYLDLLLLLTILSTSAISQTPQQFSYQAVVRDNNNQLVANRSGMRISILKDSVNGQSS
jgi:hypothetical protein